MPKYIMNKKSPILLYGAAAIGSIWHDKLTRSGFNVIAFIDRRGDEIKNFCGLPVYTLASLPPNIKADEKLTVIVTVKNVFDHHAIANDLLAQGLRKLIYRPYGVLSGEPQPWEKDINNNYDMLFAGTAPEIIELPYPAPYDIYRRDLGVMAEDEADVTACIPVDFIFTNKPLSGEEWDKWRNVHILSLFTHWELFHFLAGDAKADYEIYWREASVFWTEHKGKVKITDEWKRGMLKGRARIYQEMCLSLNLDPNFFVRSAPTAEWNELGYFNLTSGKHRTAFLVSQGHWFIPLKVSKTDYERFLNEPKIAAVKKYLTDGRRLHTPIPHPYFYRAPQITMAKYYGLLTSVVPLLAKKIYQAKKRVDFHGFAVLLDLPESGALSAFFARLGCEVSVTRNMGGLAEAVRDLGYMADRVQTVGDIGEHHYDAVLTAAEDSVFLKSSADCDECFALCTSEENKNKLLARFPASKMRRLFNTIDEHGALTLWNCSA